MCIAFLFVCQIREPEINVLKVVEPVYMTEYAISTEPIELMMDISTSNDMITPVDLIIPVNISTIAFNDVVIEEENLDLDFTVDKPVVKITSIIEPIYYTSTSNDIEFFENDLELNFNTDKPIIT